MEKLGIITSSQDIVVSAQVNGRVAQLFSKEGTKVAKGTPIITLSDTVANYGLQVERAKNALDKARLMKEQAILSLEQQFQQAKNAYEIAQKNFSFAQKSSDITMKQAGLGLTSADTSFEALKNTFLSQKIALLNLLHNILEQGDKLL